MNALECCVQPASKKEAGVLAWARRSQEQLFAIDATPHAIAIGVASGIFFSFTPLFGLKTLLAILAAWVLRGSKLAAAVAVALHDLSLPFLPLVPRWEYKAGLWLLHRHSRIWLEAGSPVFHFRDWMRWTIFVAYGQPLLLGSVLVGLPSSIIAYVVVRAAVFARQRHKFAR